MAGQAYKNYFRNSTTPYRVATGNLGSGISNAPSTPGTGGRSGIGHTRGTAPVMGNWVTSPYAAGDKETMAPPAAPTPNAPGSESGPGILESWFNQRAQGVDKAAAYAQKRGLDALGDRYSAAGSFNSGAARQGEADLIANIEAQRAGALDALAAGASGEHQRKLDSMFGQGAQIAGGQSQINSIYDIKAGDAQSDALKAALNYFLNKTGVDDKSRQQGLNNILGIWGTAAS